MSSDEITLNDIISNKYFYIGLILLFAAISRFALITINQAAWWDETQYLLMTKSFFKGTPTTGWWEGRSVFYPLILTALSMPIGFNELWIRAINALFSLGLIFMTYKLVKELYSERYALAAALITSAQWVFFFYSFRILLGIPSAFFLITSNYYFIKSLNKNWKLNMISGIFLGFAFNIRFTSGVLILVYMAYLALMKNFKPKNYVWILGFIIGFSVLGVYELIIYGNPLNSALEFLRFNLESTGGSQAGDAFYYVSTLFINYGVIIGLLAGFGLIGILLKLNKKNNLFVLLNLAVFLLFYSFVTQVKEFRFLIHLLPFISVAGVVGIMLVYNLFSKNKRFLTVFLIGFSFLTVLENSITGYERVYAASSSYDNIKLAGEYLKSMGAGSIIGQSLPQLTYYGEVSTSPFPGNETAFYSLILEKNIEYIVVSVYEQHPDYTYNLNPQAFMPIQAYPDPSNALLVIYSVNKSLITMQ